jgi:hypothetical protein
MSDRPSVVGVPEPGWTVYRIATERSSYHLSVYDGARGRPIAVLLGCSDDRRIEQTDSAPLVGGRLLFGLDHMAWIDHALEMGSVKTSPIVRVERETSAIVIRAIIDAAGVTIARGKNPRMIVENITGDTDAPRRIVPADFPYPEDNVIRLESAAHFLSAVGERTMLVEDLERFPDLMKRFQVALNECLLAVNALGGRANRSG